MTLKHGDLIGTVAPIVSIDEFQPKAGDEKDVIVVAFYFKDVEPAQDLNTFIQRGVIDVLDVEVSPNTDEEGRYLVFIEMGRTSEFPTKFKALVRDVENLTGDVKWRVKPYLSDDTFDISDPTLFDYVILEKALYKTKDEFEEFNTNESIVAFFKPSLLTNLTMENNIVTITQGRNKVIAEVVDIGDYDTVIGRNMLSESAFILKDTPFEAGMLSSMLGNCGVTPIANLIMLTQDDTVVLLKDTYISHSR